MRRAAVSTAAAFQKQFEQMWEAVMIEQRCDKCAHWSDEYDDWEVKGAGFSLCSAIKARWKITDEFRTSNGSDEEDSRVEKLKVDAIKSSKAFVQDGSEYIAELYTGPDFGCVLFTASQNEGE